MPNENEIYVNLDIVHGIDDNIEVYKGDTGRVLKIHLTSEYKSINLTGKDVRCAYIRPDGVQGMVDLINLDEPQGLCELDFEDAMFAVQGNLSLQCSVFKEKTRLYTKGFVISVKKTLVSDVDIYNSADYVSLVNAFGSVRNLQDRVKKLEEGGGSGTGGGSSLTEEQETNINKIPDLEAQIYELANPMKKPSWSLSAENSLYESGAIPTPKLIVNISDIGNVTITDIVFKQGNTILNTAKYVSGTKTYSYTLTESVTSNTTYNAEIKYTYNSKSNSDSKSVEIKFIAASYEAKLDTSKLATVDTTKASDIANIIKTNGNKILITNKARTASNITMSNSRYAYMYPKSLGALSSVKDGNNFEVLDTFTKLETQISSIDYLIYILADTATLSNGTLIFK